MKKCKLFEFVENKIFLCGSLYKYYNIQGLILVKEGQNIDGLKDKSKFPVSSRSFLKAIIDGFDIYRLIHASTLQLRSHASKKLLYK